MELITPADEKEVLAATNELYIFLKSLETKGSGSFGSKGSSLVVTQRTKGKSKTNVFGIVMLNASDPPSAYVELVKRLTQKTGVKPVGKKRYNGAREAGWILGGEEENFLYMTLEYDLEDEGDLMLSVGRILNRPSRFYQLGGR